MRKQDGLTVVEMLAATGIGLLLMAGLFELYLQTKSSWEINSDQVQARAYSRVTFDRMEKELRSADRPLVQADPNALEFTLRSLRTNQTVASTTTISYTLSADDLVRGVERPGDPLLTAAVATFVRNTPSAPIFRYLTTSGATGDLNTTAQIEVDLRVDVDPAKPPGQEQHKALFRLRQ